MALPPTDSDNISIIMLHEMWALLSQIITDKSASAEQSIDEAMDKAAGVDVRYDPAGAAVARDAIQAIRTPEKPTPPTAPGTGALPGPLEETMAPTPPQFLVSPIDQFEPLGDFGEPPVFSDGPSWDIDSMRNLYAADRAEMMRALKDSFTEFMDEYFPQGQYFDKATAWLERALDAQGAGIPIVVEAALWERDRARLTGEATRAEEEALTLWAGRGYTMPPGALMHDMQTIRAGLTNALSAQSRDIAIKVTDVHVENARFAVEQAAQIRSQAMNAAVEYIKALMVSPQYVGQWLSALIDGHAKLIGAEADVYRTRAGVATDVFKTGADVELNKFKIGADVSLEKDKTTSTMELEAFRANADVGRQKFLAELERYRTDSQVGMETFKAAQDSMLQFFEAEARATQIKSELLTRAGELDLRISDGTAKVELDKAKMVVDSAVEKARMIATQAAAALNNLQLQASASNQSSTRG